MTETLTRTERPEVYGVYLNNEPVNVVRESDHTRIVAQQDDRIVALQNLNEGKVQTIQDLREEVERAHLSEGIEVQRTAAIKRSMREQIVEWANEYDMTLDCLNELLRELGMDPVPETVVAEFEIRVVARFEAGNGTPAHPDTEWLRQHIEVLLDSANVRPGYGSSLETLTAEVEGFDVTHVEAT